MTNLADLLPAGGGQNNTDFVADGAISSGAPVVLTAAGKAAPISETSAGNSAATAQLYSSGISFYVNSVIYDPDTQRIVMVYSDALNSYYASIVVGTSSATGITWGTPVTVYSGQTVNYISTCYDTTNDRVGVAYNRFGGGGYYAAYSIDGASNTPTSIATHVQYNSSNQSYVALVYDPVENVIVSASTQGTATKISVARLGASSITLGNEVNIPNSSYANNTINLLYEKNLQKVIANYPDANNSSRLTTVVISPSGTGSPTFGTENAWLTDNPASNNTMTFDETSGKLLFTYRRNGSSPTYRGGAKVGLASGTSVTVDATETFFTSTGQAREQSAGYDATAKKIGLTYYVYSSGSETRFVDATTSASDYSVTFGTDAAAYTAVTANGIVTYNGRLPYDASVGKMVYAFNNSTTGYSYTNMLTLANTTSNLTSTNLLGIASGAISNTATGTINTWGSRNEVQTGLTIGSDYYVQDDGTITAGSTSIAYDISSLTYTQTFSVSSQDTDPTGLAFNTDGTKMFVVGNSANAIHEYALSTGFDISTASFTQSFSVASQSTAPSGIAFKPDGTIMFVAEAYNSTILQYALSSAFDVSSASYTHNFNVASQEADVRGVAFNSDGTVMLITGIGGDDVNEYALSSAYDVSSASFTDLFSIASQETNPQDLLFNSDGTTMWIVGDDNDALIQYTLTSGFDVSTASYTSTGSSLASQDTSPMGMAFNSDGTKLYVVGQQNDAVYQYATTASAFSTDYLIGKAITATQINIKDYTG